MSRKIIGAEFSDVLINAIEIYLKLKGMTKSEFLRGVVRKELEKENLLPLKIKKEEDLIDINI